MNNCLFFALLRVFTKGGYVVSRKSHYGWWPHFLYTKDLQHFEEYGPLYPNSHLPVPPVLYRGFVKTTTVEGQHEFPQKPKVGWWQRVMDALGSAAGEAAAQR